MYFQKDFQYANTTSISPLHTVLSYQARRICFKILPNTELTVPGAVAMEATLISSFPPPNMVTGLMNSTFHYGPQTRLKMFSLEQVRL